MVTFTQSTNGLWSTYCHNNVIFHREGSSWTQYAKLDCRLSKVAMDVSFNPIATSVPTSIITRLTSIAPSQRPLDQPPPSFSPSAVPKTEPHTLPSWYAVLTEQPFWAQKLLLHVYFNTITNILDPIANKVPLYVVSDSSITARQMPFGWIIGTTKGQRLASSHGSCAGRPSSL